MSLTKEEWRDGVTEDGVFVGCMGCLFIALACLALNALALLAVCQLITLAGGIIAG